jgi:hypothetical protein
MAVDAGECGVDLMRESCFHFLLFRTFLLTISSKSFYYRYT